ncbi:unnamed protein product, partial [Mesorhabditis belari]|uniref:Uncharacterized protein n=1 Tax=Mesorhabditis belari TaxID=2138241 RepID=A0AAF3J2N8_9BILA
MVDYFLPSRNADNECPYTFARVALVVFFVWDLFTCKVITCFTNTTGNRTSSILVSSDSLLPYAFFCEGIWLIFLFIVFCSHGRYWPLRDILLADARSDYEMPLGFAFIILLFGIYIGIVAFVLKVYWIYVNYLQVKKSVIVNSSNDDDIIYIFKQTKVAMEPLTPSAPLFIQPSPYSVLC